MGKSGGEIITKNIVGTSSSQLLLTSLLITNDKNNPSDKSWNNGRKKNYIESHAPNRPGGLLPNTSLVIISYIKAPAASFAAQNLMAEHHM